MVLHAEVGHMSETIVQLVPLSTSARAAMRLLGAVALAAGARGLFVGAKEVSDAPAVEASVDSEYRVYAAWYPMLGIALLSEAGRGSTDGRLMRFVAGGLGLAATGRALSIRAVGWPRRSQVGLLALEAVLAAALPRWFTRGSQSL